MDQTFGFLIAALLAGLQSNEFNLLLQKDKVNTGSRHGCGQIQLASKGQPNLIVVIVVVEGHVDLIIFMIFHVCWPQCVPASWLAALPACWLACSLACHTDSRVVCA